MSECPHDRLHAQAKPVVFADEATGIVRARMVGVSVRCGACGMPTESEPCREHQSEATDADDARDLLGKLGLV